MVQVVNAFSAICPRIPLVVVLEFVNVVGKFVDDCVIVSVDRGWEERRVEFSSVTVVAVGNDENVLADVAEEVINGVVEL